jgi:hypothetical protein
MPCQELALIYVLPSALGFHLGKSRTGRRGPRHGMVRADGEFIADCACGVVCDGEGGFLDRHTIALMAICLLRNARDRIPSEALFYLNVDGNAANYGSAP